MKKILLIGILSLFCTDVRIDTLHDDTLLKSIRKEVACIQKGEDCLCCNTYLGSCATGDFSAFSVTKCDVIRKFGVRVVE